MYPSN